VNAALEALVIAKTHRVPLPAGPAGDAAVAVRQFDAVAMSAGFKLSRGLMERLAVLDAGAYGIVCPLINNRADEAMGSIWSYLDLTALGRQEAWEDSPEGYPQTPPYKWWRWHDQYESESSPDPRWVDIITDPAAAAARRRKAEEKDCPCP